MRSIKNKCFVLIPAFNEAQLLPAVLENLIEAFEASNIRGEALIVHDGSTEETGQVIRNLRAPFPIRTVQLEHSGVGPAIQQGLEQLMFDARMDDVVVVVNANHNNDLMEISRMLQHIGEGSDVVLAPRMEASLGAQQKSFGWLTSTYQRLRHQDNGCGIRAYRAEFIKSALAHYGTRFIERSGPDAQAEILIKLKRFYPIIKQIPSISRNNRSANKLPKLPAAPNNPSRWGIGLRTASLL